MKGVDRRECLLQKMDYNTSLFAAVEQSKKAQHNEDAKSKRQQSSVLMVYQEAAVGLGNYEQLPLGGVVALCSVLENAPLSSCMHTD